MKVPFLVFSLCFCIAQVAFADQAKLNFLGSPASTISASGVTVPLYKEAKAVFPDSPTEGYSMYLSGAGILVKQIAFFKVNVYVLTSYTDSANGVLVQDPMKSIKDAKVKAIQLTLLRSVGSGEIKSEFQLALDANAIDLESPGIKDLMSHITFSMNPKDTVTFIGYSPTSMETVYVDTSTDVHFASADKDLALNLWSIWFGTPANFGYADLKKKIVGKF